MEGEGLHATIHAIAPQVVKRLKMTSARSTGDRLPGNPLGDCAFHQPLTGLAALQSAIAYENKGAIGVKCPRPFFPAFRGAFGKPTLINNVETLANVPPIVQAGADTFLF